MSSTTQIVWLGLGKLGQPMAARLAQSGQRVVGVDPNPARAALAQSRGISVAADTAAPVASADIVFTSLPSDAVVLAVTAGPDGLLSRMRRGAILVETSTTAPETSKLVAEAAGRTGIDYVRLPMSGSTVLAEQGQLTCSASGPKSAFEKIRPIVAQFTRAQTWLGEGEEARYAKLAVNLMIAVTAGSLAEALAIGRKGHIGYRQMIQVICDSVMGSPLVKYKAGPLADRDFAPTATSNLMVKDLDLILATARTDHVPVPLAAIMREIYSAIIAQGEGDEDFITTVRYTERLAGLGEP